MRAGTRRPLSYAPAVPLVDPYTPIPDFAEFAGAAAFDPADFDPAVDAFARLKSQVGEDALRRAVDTATRWAAVNTGAIEGLYEVDRGCHLRLPRDLSRVDRRGDRT